MQFMLDGIDYFAPKNKALLAALTAYLGSEFSVENLEFLIAVHEYDLIPEGSQHDATRKAKLEEIYTKYSPKDTINLSATLQIPLKELYDAREKTPLTRSGLDNAVKEIQNLIIRDGYPRFKAKGEYQQALKQVGWKAALKSKIGKMLTPIKKRQEEIKKSIQPKSEVDKAAAKELLNDKVEKWKEGLDARTAADLFRPLDKAMNRLEKAVNSASSTKKEIQACMKDVVRERNIYLKTLNARFVKEEEMIENRALAAQHRVTAGDLTQKEEYDVSLLRFLQDANGKVDPSKAKPNTIYVSEDGSYVARGKPSIDPEGNITHQGDIHHGKLKGLSDQDLGHIKVLAGPEFDLNDVTKVLNRSDFKGKVNQQHREAQKEQAQRIAEQASRIKEARATQSKDAQALAEAHKGGGILHSFRTVMGSQLQKAGIPTEDPKPAEPEPGRKSPKA